MILSIKAEFQRTPFMLKSCVLKIRFPYDSHIAIWERYGNHIGNIMAMREDKIYRDHLR